MNIGKPAMSTKWFILLFTLSLVISKIGEVDARAKGSRKKSMPPLPDTKSSWCMATDIEQSIEEKGCETKVIKNKACVGQCFSYYSPGTFPVRYAARKRTKYCDVCKPSLKSWTKISLNCPGKKNSQVDKLVEMIYDCSCKRCGRDPKKQK
ncbi:neuroblastoma suppressor of tumorigenicity 1-like [Oculina patagonica]